MQLGKIYPTLPKRHLNNYLALKRHLNILLCWVHNYMKTPKTIAKRYKIKCNWEKYTPLAKKDKKVGFAILFYI